MNDQHPAFDAVTATRILKGQRIIILTVLFGLLAAGLLRFVVPDYLNDDVRALVYFFVIYPLFLVGAFRILSSLGYSWPAKSLCALFLLVPTINLFVLAYLSIRATRALRASGYKVGFFGAKTVGA
jgi:hypothetical protein